MPGLFRLIGLGTSSGSAPRSLAAQPSAWLHKQQIWTSWKFVGWTAAETGTRVSNEGDVGFDDGGPRRMYRVNRGKTQPCRYEGDRRVRSLAAEIQFYTCCCYCVNQNFHLGELDTIVKNQGDSYQQAFSDIH